MKSPESTFLLGIIRPHKGHIALLILCMLLASIFEGISVGLTVPLLASLQMMESPEELPSILGWLFATLMMFPGNYRILGPVWICRFTVLCRSHRMELNWSSPMEKSPGCLTGLAG